MTDAALFFTGAAVGALLTHIGWQAEAVKQAKRERDAALENLKLLEDLTGYALSPKEPTNGGRRDDGDSVDIGNGRVKA